MLAFVLSFFLAIGPIKQLTRISDLNKTIVSAEKAFKAKKYQQALQHYNLAIDTLGLSSDNAKLNRAHCHFLLKNEAAAQIAYEQLGTTDNKSVASIAYNQLGIISREETERALSYFKQALKANPNNQSARLNYELFKRRSAQQKPKDKQDPSKNKDTDSKTDKQKEQDKNQRGDNKPQDQNSDPDKKQGKPKVDPKGSEAKNEEDDKDGKGKPEEDTKPGDKKPNTNKPEDKDKSSKNQEGDKPDSDNGSQQSRVGVNKDLLKDLKLTEEQAKDLLDAMKQSEVQYLQQRRRGKKKSGGLPTKPDW